MEFTHITVLQKETVEELQAGKGGLFVDATIGGAGHAEAILLAHPQNQLIGLDRDEAAIRAAEERLRPYAGRVQLYRVNFAELPAVLGGRRSDGILFDLGVSSPQLDAPERGFSYQHDAPLDMRMDTSQGLSAAELVNTAAREDLAEILRRFGEERWAERIASFIVQARARQPVRTTGELVEIVKQAVPAAARRRGPHPAKRTFQALRIAVNDELGNLAAGLQAAVEGLNPGGRLAAITFHSLEDRAVKQFFRHEADPCTCPPGLPACACGRQPRLRVITPGGITPTPAELAANPRSRSARLRVAERVLYTKVDA